MGLFDGPPLTDVDHDRLYRSAVHLNLIGQVNMLTQHNYELQAKLQLAESRIAELEAALKPFAYYAKHIHDDVSDMASASGTAGDLRRAREVLGEKNDP